MHLISVNIGKPQPIKAKSGTTGIYKLPQSAPVQIGRLGLEGDAIVDVAHHGGEDQAVYVFGMPDYEWWSNELKRDLAPGTFGENLTISELESTAFNIGDRLQVGAVLLEVTSPRIPCVTLAARMGDSRFLVRFRDAERFGLYCRVIVTGAVQAGDAVRIERFEGEAFPALEMFRLFYTKDLHETVLRRALKTPLHRETRQEYEELLGLSPPSS